MTTGSSGTTSASSRASTSSAWFPAWSRTRASAPCSRRSRSSTTAASGPARSSSATAPNAAHCTVRVQMARVREYHAVLDVFVVPRTRDRVCQLVTPLKPVEAMASGRAVVVSAVRALEEIVTDEVTGLLAPPQDAGALADRLQQLLSSPQLRKDLGHNAREWVARDRTWAHSVQRYREAYARLAV